MRRRSTRARSAPPPLVPRSQRGFSLIELIACLVILGILAAVGGPILFDRTPFDERGYMDEIASAMRNAQAVAVATTCNVSFTISPTGYQAMQQAACGAGAYTTPVLRPDGTQLAGTPPADATVATTETLIFDKDGAVANYPPAPAALVMGAASLTLDPLSGFVTVK